MKLGEAAVQLLNQLQPRDGFGESIDVYSMAHFYSLKYSCAFNPPQFLENTVYVSAVLIVYM